MDLTPIYLDGAYSYVGICYGRYLPFLGYVGSGRSVYARICNTILSCVQGHDADGKVPCQFALFWHIFLIYVYARPRFWHRPTVP